MIRGIIQSVISIIIVLLILVAVMFLLLKIFNKQILRNEVLYNLGLGLFFKFELIAPPKDYGRRLIDEYLDITKKGVKKEFKFKNKYLGNHDVELLLKSIPRSYISSRDRLDKNLEIELNFYIENKLLLSTRYNKNSHYSPFFSGFEEYYSGFMVFWYKCPKDMPIDKEITCIVEVITPDIELNEKYGPVKFIIRKGSDE